MSRPNEGKPTSAARFGNANLNAVLAAKPTRTAGSALGGAPRGVGGAMTLLGVPKAREPPAKMVDAK